MLFASPVTLFISRTEPVAKGEWGGYWGTPSIVEHFGALYSGTFRIDPDYAEERVVGLTSDVAETYAPVAITSGYGGQAPVARRFLMVLEWVKTNGGWRVATDIPCRSRPRRRSFTSSFSPTSRVDARGAGSRCSSLLPSATIFLIANIPPWRQRRVSLGMGYDSADLTDREAATA
jgi:hypothetical protein